MPAKNSIKKYVADGFYHIYNRGVEKRKIFQDQQDYKVFLSYLKTYLLPKNTLSLQKQLSRSDVNWKQKDKILKLLNLNNFHKEIELHSFCLMSNHFHLLVKQRSANSIDYFMRSLLTRYSLFFNKKNKRIGHLFQGRYKAVLVKTDEQLLHLSRYIHLNHSASRSARTVFAGSYSSYSDYIGKTNTTWLNKKTILSYFPKNNPYLSYKSFVENTEVDSITPLKNLIFDF